LEVGAGATISQFMHALNSRYTKLYCRRYIHTGHLFQGRFRAVVVEPYRMEHRRIRLEIPGLPDELTSIRIFHLSDLHTVRWGFRELFIRDALSRFPPELMIVTGDLVSGPEGVDTILELFGGIRPRLGTYFVRGNNEVEELDDPEAYLRQLRALGWVVLKNEHRAIEGISARVFVAGTDDPNNDLDRLDRTLEGIPPGAFTILLTHTPEPFPEAIRAGIPLQFSGHTHGGQIQVPGIGPIWTDTPRTGRRFGAGVFREGGSTLVLSRGVGWSLLPIRLCCAPEIIELDLVPEPPGRRP
jgi:predicted MPP superfamily phosphohydrolase